MLKVEEEIHLHLGGQLGVHPRIILGSWCSEGPEVVEHPRLIFV